MFTKKRAIVLMLAAFALVGAACGDDDGGATTTAGDGGATTAAPGTTSAPATTAGSDGDVSPLGLPIIDPLSVADEPISMAGSSTVFPLSQALLTKWEDEGGPSYSLESIGSGGGFARFCGDADNPPSGEISNASRAIKSSGDPADPEEKENCEANGRTIIEVRIGTDALSLVISNGNNFAQQLTIEELAAIFQAPAGATWDTINPDFPAHPIQAFVPADTSGTYDYFNEVVYDEAEPSPMVDCGVCENVGEEDATTVNGVSADGCTEGDTGSTCAIGFFGYAYYQENADILQAVAVDGVAPGEDTVNDGSYPISRPLFIYTAEEIVAEKPWVAEFMAYYLNNVNEVIGEVGYFPAPMEVLQEAADALKAAAPNL